MKSDTHPDYRRVVIQDVSSDFKVLTRSTAATDQTIEWEDGNTYPLIRVEISSASHPFYTGKRQLIAERGGRIEQFRRRYGDKAAGN
jgi:large subunit ribosomal protein L31